MNEWSVLVVDDEPLTQDLLRMMLEPVGFRVSGAEDGMEALACVKACKPDVMILDVMMPKLDGLSVCRALRSNPETADLPIVMLSGKVSFGAEDEGLAAGADLYLTKPMSRTVLIQSLRNLVNHSRHAPN